MRLLWICDSWSAINNPTETTIRLMEESLKLGHQSWYCDARTIVLERKKLQIRATRIHRKKGVLSIADMFTVKTIASFDKVFLRFDPSFDLSYFHKLKLLCYESTKKDVRFEIINDPAILLTHDSKITAELFLAGDTASTLFSCDWEILKEFGISNKKVVAKPIGSFSGVGVQLLDFNSSRGIAEAGKIIKDMTADFSQHILLQEYIDIFTHGEIRIWFACGKIICVVQKKLKGPDFRFNLDHGDELRKYQLTAHEKKIAARIGLFLKKRGIKMAAIDLINSKIIDFNISSPGLLKEMEDTWGQNFSNDIMQLVMGA